MSPISQYNEEFYSESETEDLAEMEAELYSRLHHNESLDENLIISSPNPSKSFSKADVQDPMTQKYSSKLIIIDEFSNKSHKHFVSHLVASENSSDDSSSSGNSIDSHEPNHLTLNIEKSKKNSRVFQHDQIDLPSLNGSQREIFQSPKGWTKEMKTFYNEIDERKLNVTLEDYSKDFKEIKTKSLAESFKGRNYYSKRKRCFKCNEFGHGGKECCNSKKPLVCFMCSQVGHLETRCPFSSCLNCGSSTKLYVLGCSECRRHLKIPCKLCTGKGHSTSQCSLHWRQSHMYSSFSDPSKTSTPTYKDSKDVWCCNCAAQGHYLSECSAFFPSSFPPPSLPTSFLSKPCELTSSSLSLVKSFREKNKSDSFKCKTKSRESNKSVTLKLKNNKKKQKREKDKRQILMNLKNEQGCSLSTYKSAIKLLKRKANGINDVYGRKILLSQIKNIRSKGIPLYFKMDTKTLNQVSKFL